MSRTLHDISEDLLALEAMLEDLGGDVTDDDVAAFLDDWFERATADRDKKIDNYAALILELETRAEVRRAEAKRLADKAKRDEDRARYLKERLQVFYETHGLSKLETPRFTVSLARNGGRLPLLLDLDPEQLPASYRSERVTYTPDQEAIRAALDAGEVLAFARYGDRGQSLRIR